MKKKWLPKEGEKYYFVAWHSEPNGMYVGWAESYLPVRYNCFRHREDAKKALVKIKKILKTK